MTQQKPLHNYATPQFVITNWHNVKTEVATVCAKHGNMKAEVAARKAEVRSFAIFCRLARAKAKPNKTLINRLP